MAHVHERMGSGDALLWMIEKDPMLRSTMVLVTMLDRAPDADVFRESMDRMSRMVPRLRQRLVNDPYDVAPPCWEYDPSFDLDFHVRYTRARGGGSDRDVLDRAQQLCMEGFDWSRPLWQFEAMDGLEGGAGAFLVKMHHAITDAHGFLAMSQHMFDTERDGWKHRGPMPPEPTGPLSTPAGRLASGVAHEARVVAGYGRRIAGAATMAVTMAARRPAEAVERASNIAVALRTVVDAQLEVRHEVRKGRSLRRRFDAFSLEFPPLKAAAKAAGATFNDAFVAAVAGGMRRYNDVHDPTATVFDVKIPVSLRTSDTTHHLDNQLALARVRIPLDVDDPVARMKAVHGLVGEAKKDPALAAFGTISDVLIRTGATVATAVLAAMTRGTDSTLSNVAGPPMPLYLAGSAVETLFGFTPLGSAPTSFALASYNGGAHLGIVTDAAVITEPDRLVECVREGFDEIAALGRPAAATPRRK